MPDNVTDMEVNSRDFQRDFAQMKAKASSGVAIRVSSNGETFIFKSERPRSWQGALKGKAEIIGDLLSTGLDWEASS